MDPPSSPAPSFATWLAGVRQRLPAWASLPAGLVVAAVLAVVAVAGLILVLRAPAGPAPRLSLPQAGATGPGSAGGSGLPGAVTTAPTGMATVHAAGAVASPGVYAVPAGLVADVLTAAGGPLPEADLDRLNLAARVADGDRVYVLRKGEAGPPSGAGDLSSGAAGGPTTAAGPLDLNTATAEQLDTLPGVGPATAQAIISYRTRHGRFRSVTELLEVPGIGPAKLEAVRSLVRV